MITFCGNKLRYWRKYRGYTMSTMGADLDMSYSLISRYESSKIKKPSFETITRMANYLECSIMDLSCEIDTCDLCVEVRAEEAAEAETAAVVIPQRVDVHVHVKIDWGFS